MDTVSPQNAQPAAYDIDQELCELALDNAPRVFAVTVQYDVAPGVPDGEIAAWGLAYSDGTAHVITADGRHRLSLKSPERAAWWFGRRGDTTARLLWFAAPSAPAFQSVQAA
ncbi:hypothetical protein ABZ547_12995 [Streptomyces sparsogenes]|uniref:hypothetical protein n=1 Tax=Streptomyces sparsogenes TaxID=67365 RepID=UPI0033CB05DC